MRPCESKKSSLPNVSSLGIAPKAEITRIQSIVVLDLVVGSMYTIYDVIALALMTIVLVVGRRNVANLWLAAYFFVEGRFGLGSSTARTTSAGQIFLWVTPGKQDPHSLVHPLSLKPHRSPFCW
jgi:hypothetical protein